MNVVATSLENQTYQINSGSAESPALNEFSVSPTYCSITYTYNITPTVPALATILFDSATRIFTYESTDNSTIDIYTITVQSLDHLGVDLGASSTFELEFVDFCSQATLEPSLLNYDLEYTIGSEPSNLDLSNAFLTSISG